MKHREELRIEAVIAVNNSAYVDHTMKLSHKGRDARLARKRTNKLAYASKRRNNK
ncbi:MAG: hypothetical protein HOG49_05540 [Candidatus Scalindua sp.]|nr:hypothetical protein [Candidatus Scalindua sp.]